MIVQMQMRRGTASEWCAANPILAAGEPGYDENSGNFKIGDGTTPWNDLGYQTSDLDVAAAVAAGEAATAAAADATAAAAAAADAATVAGSIGSTNDTLIAGRLADSASATRAELAKQRIVNARDFGVVGNGTTDDTTALQAFITYLTTNGVAGFLPVGTYKITSTLAFSRRPGWELIGAGRNKTIISQATDNIPVLNLGSDTASILHTWGISDLQLTYANTQPSTNTAAIPMLFSQEVNNGYVKRVKFGNGYYGVKVASGVGGPWGTDWDALDFSGSLTGGAMDWSGAVNAVPNNHFGRIFVTATAMTQTIFRLRGYNWVIDTIEMIAATNGVGLMEFAAGAQCVIGSVKLENGNYATSKTLFDIQASSAVRIGTVSIGGSSMVFAPASGSVYVFGISSGGGSAYLDIGHLDLDASTAITAGKAFAFTGGTGQIELGKPVLANGWALQNSGGSTTGDLLNVRAYNNGHLSGNKGDADYTITLGDPTIVSFETTLTAVRTVNLPISDNIHNGLTYRVRSYGAVNGTNTILVKAGGNLKGTVATDKTVLDFTWRRNGTSSLGWVLTGAQTLP